MANEIPVSTFPRLTPQEKATPLWQKLVAHMEAELKNKRGKNDNVALTETQTAALRGQIELLKGLIALQDVPPIVE